jgi:hypothetical protein
MTEGGGGQGGGIEGVGPEGLGWSAVRHGSSRWSNWPRGKQAMLLFREVERNEEFRAGDPGEG